VSRMPGFRAVDHVGLTVPDLDAAVRFYSEALGAKELYRLGPLDSESMSPPDASSEAPSSFEAPSSLEAPSGGASRCETALDWTGAHLNVSGARLTLCMLELTPSLWLELFQYDAPADRATVPPRNCDAGGHHLAFSVDLLEPALEHLAAAGCQVLAGPIEVDLPKPGTRLQYVLDPFGNQLELVQLPDDR